MLLLLLLLLLWLLVVLLEKLWVETAKLVWGITKLCGLLGSVYLLELLWIRASLIGELLVLVMLLLLLLLGLKGSEKSGIWLTC